MIFEEIKTAVAGIAQIQYYDPKKETWIKCDASHSGLGATLEQKTEDNEWVPIAFASSYLNVQEKKYSTNDFELLAVVWAVDRFEHYLLGKEFILATGHKALTSALGEYKSNKTYQSRLTRWVDRLLPYQFKVVYIPGKDMGILDYMSREPNGEPWLETYLDGNFVVASIECFHKALNCLSSRLNVTAKEIQDENILEHSGLRDTLNELKDKSSHSCYSNRSVQKRIRLDRNENGLNSSLSKFEQNNLCKISPCKWSVDKITKRNSPTKQVYLEMSSRLEEKLKKTVKIVERDRSRDQLLEQGTETTYRRTRTVHRGQDSDISEHDTPQIEWRKMDLINRRRDSGQSTSTLTHLETTLAEPQRLISFWDLVGFERADKVISGSLLELEASTNMLSPQEDTSEGVYRKIIEVDLTADSSTSSPEVSLVGGQKSVRKSRKEEFRLAEEVEDNNLNNLSKLFDRNLLAELTTEDTWMDRLRRVIERKDRHSFELMGPYTNSLWHQMAVVDDCIVVDGRLADRGQLRPAVLKRIHRGHPGQEAMLDVSKYLWWPHMHKDIVNLAEECRSCSRYGKNVKYIIPNNESKPLPLLTQLPGQELQLDYAGPLEDKKWKKIYLLTAIDRYSKIPSVKITKSTGGKSWVNFLRTYIDTHGIPESIRTDQFSAFKGKTMKKFCSENNIELKFCPVGDHRGCGLVERTIQTIKWRLGVMLLDENVTSIKLALSTIIRDFDAVNKKRLNVRHSRHTLDDFQKRNSRY